MSGGVQIEIYELIAEGISAGSPGKNSGAIFLFFFPEKLGDG